MENGLRFLTVGEAAEALRVKKATVYAWVHQRRIPFRKHGARVVFREDELRAWSAASLVMPVGGHGKTMDGCDGDVAAGSLKTERNRTRPS